MTQAPQGLGESMGVGRMPLGAQAGVVIENAIENVGGFPGRTGDDLGGIDAESVTEMGINADGLVVMTEISGMVGTDECAGRDGDLPRSTGWYVVGGTSASAPQWAGLIAIADQVAGRNLGYINPALYEIANNPAQYASDFFDVTANCNQTRAIASSHGLNSQ